jgi:excisionase family DNA binding protein
MKIWLNVAEAAEYAGVSRDTIYTACERREIHHAHRRAPRDPAQGRMDRRLARTARTSS